MLLILGGSAHSPHLFWVESPCHSHIPSLGEPTPVIPIASPRCQTPQRCRPECVVGTMCASPHRRLDHIHSYPRSPAPEGGRSQDLSSSFFVSGFWMSLIQTSKFQNKNAQDQGPKNVEQKERRSPGLIRSRFCHLRCFPLVHLKPQGPFPWAPHLRQFQELSVVASPFLYWYQEPEALSHGNAHNTS